MVYLYFSMKKCDTCSQVGREVWRNTQTFPHIGVHEKKTQETVGLRETEFYDP